MKVRTSSGNFSQSFLFTKPIHVSESGVYSFSFYNIFNCLTTANCSAVNDTISIKLRKGIAGLYNEIYLDGTSYGRLNDDKWIRKEVLLQMLPDDYYVVY